MRKGQRLVPEAWEQRQLLPVLLLRRCKVQQRIRCNHRHSSSFCSSEACERRYGRAIRHNRASSNHSIRRHIRRHNRCRNHRQDHNRCRNRCRNHKRDRSRRHNHKLLRSSCSSDSVGIPGVPEATCASCHKRSRCSRRRNRCRNHKQDHSRRHNHSRDHSRRHSHRQVHSSCWCNHRRAFG